MTTENTATADQVADGLKGLVRWAVGLKFADIPEPVRRRALLILCDDVAAIVAARIEPEVTALQTKMAASAGKPEATVFRGGSMRLDRYSAAVANGAAADWCELDEGYRRAMCHAGLYTVPSLLAEGEACGATTEAMARALVVGYEVAARFARTFRFKKLVLHPHGSLAAVGAAAAVAALRGSSAERFMDAVSAASTMVVPGPFNHAVSGALVRNVWPAAGAWCGMRAVDWAECGIGGLPQSPYYVFVDAFGGDAYPEELTDGLGAEWAVSDGYHKIHACCQYSHSSVEATLDVFSKLPGRPAASEIAKITVESHKLGLALDNAEPATTLAAKFSMPHIVAATAALGHAGAEAFAASTLTDPTIKGLRDRVVMKAHPDELPSPNDRNSRVTIELKDGRSVQGECLSARGGPDRPFSTDEIVAKIGRITESVYPAFPDIARRLIGLDPGLLAKPWKDVVAEFTGSGK